MNQGRFDDLGQRITHFVIVHHWWVMAGVSLLTLLNELYDHYFSSQPSVQVEELVKGIILYSFILPITGGIVLGLYEKSEGERLAAQKAMDQEVMLSHRIAQASRWNDLVSSIAEFPSRILPVVTSALYVVNRPYDILEYASGWSLHGNPVNDFPTDIPLSRCASCKLREDNPNNLVNCPCDLPKNSRYLSSFCLPFVHDNQLVGFLQISFPAGMTIPLNKVKEFSRLAPEISLALDRAIMHRSMLNQAAANEAERRRIAQDLHDSLAQNIGYLRLKLDQLTGEDAIEEITEIRSDLQRMKEIADQSYDQVRETLTHLRPVESMNLEASINNFAHSIGDRAGFRIQFETSGRHLPIPLAVFRQVSFICQEAIVNIEKHANARIVDICMDWLEDALLVRIEDNGVGFISNQEAVQGHYGIAIMNERAAEIRATLQIHSIPGKGTKINLQVPLPRTDAQPIEPTRKEIGLLQEISR